MCEQPKAGRVQLIGYARRIKSLVAPHHAIAVCLLACLRFYQLL